MVETPWPAWRATEFVVLCGNAEQNVVEERLKGRIGAVVSEVDNDLKLQGFRLTASVGVVWSSGSEITAAELLSEAHASLLHAKAGR